MVEYNEKLTGNADMVTVKMKRIELCDLLIATTCIEFDSREELGDASTSETRKKVLEGTIKKWGGLHDMLEEQLKAHDEGQTSEAGAKIADLENELKKAKQEIVELKAKIYDLMV